MTGIFSGRAIHQEVHLTETGELAGEFIENAIIASGGTRPGYIHADNGTSMTSKTVADLLTDLKITTSHSRPHLSNDNPHSEANFKTLQYCPAFPGSFATLGEARQFCGIFFTYYNNEHRHSGVGLHTPASVHDGTARAIRTRRQQVLDAAYGPPRPVPRTAPDRAQAARPGLDQQTPHHHRDQGGHTDKTSRLMSHSV
jgi:putative transposase